MSGPPPTFDSKAFTSDNGKDLHSAASPQSKLEGNGEADPKTSEEPVPKKDEPSTPNPILLHGSQTVKKFNRTIPDEILIILALYRIESKSVDLVFTANLPVATEGGDGMSVVQLNEAKVAFITAARSLRIVDFSLFV